MVLSMGDGDGYLQAAEMLFGRRFAQRGEQISWIPPERSRPTPDFTWHSLREEAFELKSSSSAKAAIRAIKRDRRRAAAHPWAPLIKLNYVVDLGELVLTSADRDQLADYNRVHPGFPIAQLRVLSDDGEALEAIQLRRAAPSIEESE